MRFRLLIFVSILGTVGLFGCSGSESPGPTASTGPVPSSVDDPCGEITTVRLLAGQTIDIGSVTVENDGEELCVRYETVGDWLLYETHLDIRLTLGDIPQTRSGNPKVGKFSYSHDLTGTSLDEFCFPLTELGYTSGMDLVVAAHAAVERVVDGASVQEETAWGEGPEFPGNSWAMYLGHTVQECSGESPFGEGDFTTVPQSEWAGECAGTNSASCYLLENWIGCFGDGESGAGLVVGCAIEGTSITFTSPEAIQQYLPIFGPSFPLLESYFNPQVIEDEEGGFHEAGEGGELIGQIVALTLSLQFDLCDPAFGQSDTWLGDLVVCTEGSPFFGWTVSDVLEEANQALGGCSSSFTLAELNAALAAINGTFVPGQPVGSFLCEQGGNPE